MITRTCLAALVCFVLLTCQTIVNALDPMHDVTPAKLLDDWIADLDSDDQQTRYSAAVTISKMDRVDRKALPALLKALDDEHHGVREASLESIANMGADAKSAVPKLVELLNKSEGFRANHLGMVIGKMGGPETKSATRRLLVLDAPKCGGMMITGGYLDAFPNRTVSQVVELLKDDSAQVRTRAAQLLGTLNTQLNRIGTTFLDKVDATEQSLATALRPLLKDKESLVRIHAGGAIAKLTPNEARDAIPAIIEGLTEQAFGASQIESLIGPLAAEAMPRLIKALDHENESVHFEVTSAITKWPKLAMPHLKLAIKNDSARIRAGAAYSLGSVYYTHSRDDAINCLVAMLDDVDAEVRLRSAESLSRLEATQAKVAIPVFISILRDELPDRRQRAASSVGRLGPTAKDAIPALVETLKDAKLEIRLAAAVAITKIDVGHASAVLPILEETIVLNDPRFSTQQHQALTAAQTLGASAEPLGSALVSKLREPLDRNNFHMQLQTAKTLASVDETKAHIGVEKLTEMLPEHERFAWYKRIKAIEALLEIGPSAKTALPALLKLINDKQPRVAALAAVTAIKIDTMQSNEAWAYLRTALTISSPTKEVKRAKRQLVTACIRALQKDEEIATALLPELIAILEIPECDVASSTIYLLLSLGPAAVSAVPALKKLASGDSYFSDEAQEAIDEITAAPADTSG